MTAKPVETGAYFSAVCRMLKAGAERLAMEDPQVCVECVHELETWVAEVRAAAVHGMRRAGYSDREIGEAFGVTQQAVSKRWPRAQRRSAHNPGLSS